MTVLSERRVAAIQRKFDRYIHNEFITARLLVRETTVIDHPDYQGHPEKVYHDFVDFKCSFYSILSGKLTRVFRTDMVQLLERWGMFDDAAFIVQFLTHQPTLLVGTGTVRNAAPSSTSLYDDHSDFLNTGIRVGALVSNATDGSTAVVTVVAEHTLTTEALSGGTANLYSATDLYSVHNYNDLQINDQLQIEGKWRTVLDVISDSTGVQTSALLSD